MLYMIIGEDRDDSLAARLDVRPDHVARLQQLKADGRLLLAGPNPAIDAQDPGEAGFSGSLIVAEFDTLEAATDWAEEDPYKKTGVYKNVIIKPFRKVLP